MALAELLELAADALDDTGEAMARRFARCLRDRSPMPPHGGGDGFPLGEFPGLGLRVSARTRPLVDELSSVADRIMWFQSPEARVPPGWAHRSAAAELVGPDGMIAEPSLRFGIFYLSPGLHYPEHWHEAEEFYYVLAGAADWTITGQRRARREAGDLVRTPSMAHHAIETGAEPLLALWGWDGNIDYGTYAYRTTRSPPGRALGA